MTMPLVAVSDGLKAGSGRIQQARRNVPPRWALVRSNQLDSPGTSDVRCEWLWAGVANSPRYVFVTWIYVF